MKHIFKAILISSLLLIPTMAEEVMKISLSGSVSEENLSTLSKIVFTENTMVAGSNYNLDEIEKIEFYDDGGSIAIVDKVQPHSSTTSPARGQIGFSVNASTLSLTLPKASYLSVTLFNLNGQKVAELFSGNANAGGLNLNLTTANLATGVYSVMVKRENTIFARKLIIK